MNFKCTCRMVYGDNGPVGKTRSASCEIHGSVAATAKYRECLTTPCDCNECRGIRATRPVGHQPMYIADYATGIAGYFAGTNDMYIADYATGIAGYFAGTNEDGTVDVVVGDARFKFRNEATAECEQQKTSLTLPAPQKILYRELPTGPSRANALADRCQTLEDEKRGLEVENSRLRREVERLGRKR